MMKTRQAICKVMEYLLLNDFEVFYIY